MSIVLDCYNNIVGLTRTDCECYTDIPTDAAESKSGLYLDELVGLSFIQSMTNCDNGDDLFQNMVKARERAIVSFMADTNALLLQNFKMRRPPFKGGVGRAVDNNKNSLLSVGDYAYVVFRCNNIKGAVMVLKDIGTFFYDTGVISLTITNNLGDEIAVVDINAVANKHEHNPINLELPMSSPYVDNLEYYFTYQYDGITKPKINDIKCSCGSFKPVFNCNDPYYTKRHDSMYGWADWIMVGGAYGANPPGSSPCGSKNTSNYMWGLTFGVEFKCKIGELLCDEQMDFEGNPLAPAVAIAIQHKAGENLGNWVLQSGNLNRFTLINTEQFIEDVKNYKKTYIEMIQYIVESADITQNDCFTCKDVYEMTKRGIFA